MKKSVLITCPKCGYMIYGRLWRCPQCGDADSPRQSGEARQSRLKFQARIKTILNSRGH